MFKTNDKENNFKENDEVLIILKSDKNITTHKGLDIKLKKGFSMKNYILNIFKNDKGKEIYSFDISEDPSDYAELNCTRDEIKKSKKN